MATRDSAVAAFAKNAGQLHASRILGESGYSKALFPRSLHFVNRARALVRGNVEADYSLVT